MAEFPEDHDNKLDDEFDESGSKPASRKGKARERQERRRKRNPNLRNEVLGSLSIDHEGLPDPETEDVPETPPIGLEKATPPSSSRISTPRSTARVTPRSTPMVSPSDDQEETPASRARRSRRTDAEEYLSRDWVPREARQRVKQVVPTDRFKLPDIDRRLLRAGIYLIGGILLVSGIIFGLGLFREDEPELPPNAIWIGTEWTYNSHTDEEIQDYVDQLRSANIGTIYAWVSWLKEDQEWAGIRAQQDTFEEVREDVQTFVTQFKEAYPESELLGWIGVPIDVGEYRLNNAEVQQKVADFSYLLVTELGFDGVFLNVEQVWNDNADDFVDFLQTVRAGMRNEGLIAVTIPPDWSPLEADIPKPPLIRPGTEWDKEFKQRVALLSDQMAVMAYNSGLSDPNEYSQWVAYQVQVYAEAVAELRLTNGSRVFIGIPTYDDELPGHSVAAENIPSALLGVEQGLQASGAAASVIHGVAIYAGWETDEDEWRQFRDLWSGR